MVLVVSFSSISAATPGTARLADLLKVFQSSRISRQAAPSSVTCLTCRLDRTPSDPVPVLRPASLMASANPVLLRASESLKCCVMTLLI